jgi:hypothetical protein
MLVIEDSPLYKEILQQGVQQGLLLGITVSLEVKFGNPGLQLLPEIRAIEDVTRLEAIQAAIMTVNTLDELSQLYR